MTNEHIVLFKLKPNVDPSKINAMINGVNGRISLDPVLHLTAGPILCIRSPLCNFTHVLHSRYASKEDLAAYAVHPTRMAMIKANELKGLKDGFSCGENIFPDRAKGFSITALAVFQGVNEMEAVDAEFVVDLYKDKLQDYLDSFIVIDFLLPSP
ncbi:Dabb domain-containing protein [Cephalotus follicularis]|uniref:Dabb domain-containing protein n=1 Tax=Cephalotus follicularis TaxID=3775 RepID=A0A1Q3BRW7_CEPFO|nr:Dabb domain-containing protein [Cephalotus follicularis]